MSKCKVCGKDLDVGKTGVFSVFDPANTVKTVLICGTCAMILSPLLVTFGLVVAKVLKIVP